MTTDDAGWMGDADGAGNPGDGDTPVHEVWVDAFPIDATTVTTTAFARFVSDTGYRTESEVYGSSCTTWPSIRKVRELENLWFAEAGAIRAFPLDDRSAFEILVTPRPVLSPPCNRYVYHPDTAEWPRSS